MIVHAGRDPYYNDQIQIESLQWSCDSLMPDRPPKNRSTDQNRDSSTGTHKSAPHMGPYSSTSINIMPTSFSPNSMGDVAGKPGDEVTDDQGEHSSRHFDHGVDHDGTRIHVSVWKPSAPSELNVLPPILIIHDVAEDSSYYEEAAAFLAHRGFCVYGMDLRGHGQSGKLMGHVNKFSDLVHDTLQIASWLRYQHKGVAPILIGQGIGAIVALDFQKSHSRYCVALVLSAPTLVLHHAVPSWKRVLIRSFGEISPTRRIPMSLMPRLHHFDESARAAASRFVTTIVAVSRTRMSLGFAKTLLNAIDRLPKRLDRINCPTLALIPQSSDVINPAATAALLNALKSPLLEVVMLKHGRHNLLTESYSERIALLEKLANWLMTSIPAKSAEAAMPAPPKTIENMTTA